METILLIPEYANEVRSSLAQIAQNLMRKAAQRDDIHLVVPYPKEGSRWKNWNSPAEKWGVSSPNVEFVPVLMDKYSECALGRVSTDWVNSKFGGRQDYHVVATLRTTSPISIKRLFSKTFIGFRPDVVSLFGFGDIMRSKSLAPDLPAEMLFQCYETWNLIMGTTGYWKHFSRQLFDYFSRSLAHAVLETSKPLAIGIDVNRLDAVVPMQHETQKLRVVYGGRYGGVTCSEEGLKLSELLFKRGVDVEYGMYLVSDRIDIPQEAIDDLSSRPYVHLELNAEPIDTHFWAYGKTSDIFIYSQAFGNYGLWPLEMLYCGAIGVFLDMPNIRGMVPDDYPYICKSKGDCLELANVLCNRIKREETVYDKEKMRQFIRENHNRDAFDKYVLDFLVTLSRMRSNRIKAKCIADIEKEFCQ